LIVFSSGVKFVYNTLSSESGNLFVMESLFGSLAERRSLGQGFTSSAASQEHEGISFEGIHLSFKLSPMFLLVQDVCLKLGYGASCVSRYGKHINAPYRRCSSGRVDASRAFNRSSQSLISNNALLGYWQL